MVRVGGGLAGADAGATRYQQQQQQHQQDEVRQTDGPYPLQGRAQGKCVRTRVRRFGPAVQCVRPAHPVIRRPQTTCTVLNPT
jgi:hypothetical protein